MYRILAAALLSVPLFSTWACAPVRAPAAGLSAQGGALVGKTWETGYAPFEIPFTLAEAVEGATSLDLVFTVAGIASG